jgi:putative nucleotidyltransferase with HDIG domain
LDTLDLDERVKMMANLIFLVDRVDVLCASYCAEKNCKPILAKTHIIEAIQTLDEGHFYPQLFKVFLHVSQDDQFWLNLENVRPLLQSKWDMQTKSTLPLSCLRTIATLFSCFVDAKSSYTAEHSLDVANLSLFVAKRMGLDDITAQKIEIAALLHDLGKLRIPDSILDKAGPLSPEEYKLVRRHAEDTYAILSQIEGIEEIALWAGDHHEKLNGEGYPKFKNNSNLPLASRIITACDMMQALVQDRPYRESMSLEKSLEILAQGVKSKELDHEVVACIHAHSDECYKAATAHSVHPPI